MNKVLNEIYQDLVIGYDSVIRQYAHDVSSRIDKVISSSVLYNGTMILKYVSDPSFVEKYNNPLDFKNKILDYVLSNEYSEIRLSSIHSFLKIIDEDIKRGENVYLNEKDRIFLSEKVLKGDTFTFEGTENMILINEGETLNKEVISNFIKSNLINFPFFSNSYTPILKKNGKYLINKRVDSLIAVNLEDMLSLMKETDAKLQILSKQDFRTLVNTYSRDIGDILCLLNTANMSGEFSLENMHDYIMNEVFSSSDEIGKMRLFNQWFSDNNWVKSYIGQEKMSVCYLNKLKESINKFLEETTKEIDPYVFANYIQIFGSERIIDQIKYEDFNKSNNERLCLDFVNNIFGKGFNKLNTLDFLDVLEKKNSMFKSLASIIEVAIVKKNLENGNIKIDDFFNISYHDKNIINVRINTNVKILYGEDDKILYGWEQIFKRIMADQSIISTNKQKKNMNIILKLDETVELKHKEELKEIIKELVLNYFSDVANMTNSNRSVMNDSSNETFAQLEFLDELERKSGFVKMIKTIEQKNRILTLSEHLEEKDSIKVKKKL